jgi:hypothetical protein
MPAIPATCRSAQQEKGKRLLVEQLPRPQRQRSRTILDYLAYKYLVKFAELGTRSCLIFTTLGDFAGTVKRLNVDEMFRGAG